MNILSNLSSNALKRKISENPKQEYFNIFLLPSNEVFTLFGQMMSESVALRQRKKAISMLKVKMFASRSSYITQRMQGKR